MSSPQHAGNPPTEPDDELDEKLKLVEFSYAEVLDATKHQDDKIGQLLTSISFLTAATLALAALGSGGYLTRDFTVRPFQLPLALITLAAFLLGVAWSVMLLLTSLSTPLRLPGLGRPSGSKAREIRWARGVRASPVYFYTISRIPLERWAEKWDAPVGDLKAERMDSLVAETHNLGVRTRAKYDRTTEAVGILSLALLAFALSVVLIAIVAMHPGGGKPVALKLFDRVMIGSVFGVYVWLQILGSLRYRRQAVDEAPDTKSPSRDRRIYRAEQWYNWLIAALIIAILEYDNSWPGLSWWIAAISLLTIGCIVAYRYAVPPPGAPATAAPRKPWKDRWHDWRAKPVRSTRSLIRRKWRRLWGKAYLRFAASAAAFTGVAIWLGVQGWWAGQFWLVSFGVLVLIGQGILQPTLVVRSLRRQYYKDLAEQAKPSVP
jgi:hypothetical protein